MGDTEELLNKLRKKESNRTCANCDATSQLGFQNVCIKFRTFVCSNCKSAHQSYSHRVKSVTMSTWTMPEVESLQKKNGGGNAAARAKYFANMTSEERRMWVPKEGDRLNAYKQLIFEAYEKKRWYKSTGKASKPNSNSSSNGNKRLGEGTNGSSSRKKNQVQQQQSASKVDQAAETNLLDFSGELDGSTQPQQTPYLPSSTQSNGQSHPQPHPQPYLGFPQDNHFGIQQPGHQSSSAPYAPNSSAFSFVEQIGSSSQPQAPTQPNLPPASFSPLMPQQQQLQPQHQPPHHPQHAQHAQEPSQMPMGLQQPMGQQQMQPPITGQQQMQPPIMGQQSQQQQVQVQNLQPAGPQMYMHGQGQGQGQSVGEDDPFAGLQRQRVPRRMQEQQFIEAAAQMTGDPFAGLQMKQTSRPPQQRQRAQQQQQQQQPQMQGPGMMMMMHPPQQQQYGQQQQQQQQQYDFDDPFAGL